MPLLPKNRFVGYYQGLSANWLQLFASDQQKSFSLFYLFYDEGQQDEQDQQQQQQHREQQPYLPN